MSKIAYTENRNGKMTNGMAVNKIIDLCSEELQVKGVRWSTWNGRGTGMDRLLKQIDQTTYQGRNNERL